MKATYAGWSCPVGPAVFVDFLVDPDHAEEIPFEDFAREADAFSAPLDDTQFEILATDWSVTWLRTKLPSGCPAWVMQHSGIEYLFLEEGQTFDLEEESRLAEVWEDSL